MRRRALPAATPSSLGVGWHRCAMVRAKLMCSGAGYADSTKGGASLHTVPLRLVLCWASCPAGRCAAITLSRGLWNAVQASVGCWRPSVMAPACAAQAVLLCLLLPGVAFVSAYEDRPGHTPGHSLGGSARCVSARGLLRQSLGKVSFTWMCCARRVKPWPAASR